MQRGHRSGHLVEASSGNGQPGSSRLPRSTLLLLIVLCVHVPAGAQERTALQGLDLPEWTLEETLRLGSLDGEWDAFVSPGLPREGPGGVIVLLDRGLPAVRLFDRDGRYIRDLGRQGEGPGEYVSPASIGVYDDRVWIADQRLRRFTEFEIDGRTLRTATLPGGAARSDLPMPIERVTGDRYVALTPLAPALGSQSRAGPIEFPQAVVRLDAEMRVLDTLASVHVESPLLTTGGADMVYFDPLPAWPLTLHIQDRGRFQIDRSLDTRDGGSLTFRVTRIDYGETVDSLTRVFQDLSIPVSDATRERVEAQLERQLDGYTPSRRDEVEPLMRDRIVDVEPPVASANIDPAGRLWLLRERDRSNPHWLVLGPELEPVARVPLPDSGAHTPFFGFTASDELWVRVEGELGTATLVRYRIDRG